MLSVKLVSMPYTILTMPSVGLAQLQAVVRSEMPGKALVDTAYCYLDFAEFVGHRNYTAIGTFESHGIFDWMFRHIAFDVDDNTDSYTEHFFADGDSPRKRKVLEGALTIRGELSNFLDTLIDRYSMLDYRLVGFTSMMSQNVSSFALAKRLKERNPDVITCLGGPNAEHPMGKSIAEHIPQIDYVFAGEALVSFPKFLRLLADADYEGIPSIRGIHLGMDHTARVAPNKSRTKATSCLPVQIVQPPGGCGTADLEQNSGETFNLNDLPMLDYSEYLFRIGNSSLRDDLKAELILPFQTSTGCWWADKVPCSFCGLTPHAFRQMTSEKAKSYIRELIFTYRDKFSIFEATDPCMPVEYPQEVFPFVNQDKGAVLQYEVKAKMPVEDMREMANANVILPQPGIESLSTRTLKIMRKGVTAFHNVQFLKYCAEYGLYPIWNYLYGFPNHNYDELDSGKLIEDLQTLSHLPPPSSNLPIAFQRYSEYFKDRDKYSLRLSPLDHYFYIYPLPREAIEDMVYTFVDHDYAQRFSAKYSDNIQAVNVEITNWMCKFREQIPKLYFENEDLVRDTRFEKSTQHRLHKTECEILHYLNEPHTAAEIEANFNMTQRAAEEMITKFDEKRFLFSERGKHLNVVCNQCLLKDDIYKNYYVDFVKNSSTAFN